MISKAHLVVKYPLLCGRTSHGHHLDLCGKNKDKGGRKCHEMEASGGKQECVGEQSRNDTDDWEKEKRGSTRTTGRGKSSAQKGDVRNSESWERSATSRGILTIERRLTPEKE